MLPIRVHCWGGLGSQLFAFVAANRMKSSFPKRQVQIMLHTGGATRRVRELPNLVDIQVFEIDDFSNASNSFRPKKLWVSRFQDRLTREIKLVSKRILLVFGFFKSFDTEDEWGKISPWIVSVRGHYSQLQLTFSDLELVYQLVLRASVDKPPAKIFYHKANVHIRLGDLISVKPEALDFIPKLIGELQELDAGYPVSIYSDSNQDDVLKIMGSIPRDVRFQQEVSASHVIYDSIFSDTFIGSNSKITFWIAALRVHLELGSLTIVPSNIFHWLQDSLVSYNLDALGVREYRN